MEPGSANAVAPKPSTLPSTSAFAAPLTFTPASPFASPKPWIARPRTTALAAAVPWISSPLLFVPESPRISTSGPATVPSARPSTPTVPPVPSVTLLVLPTFAVWVVPSTDVSAAVMAGRSVTPSVITATPATLSRLAIPARRPACARPSLIMNTDTSLPAAWPTMASPAFSRALLLRMNCLSEPWSESFTLTIVLKLKPKLMLTRLGPPPNVTVVIDWAVVVAVVSWANVNPVVLGPASTREGTSPPTRSVTAAGAPLPEEASVRKVWTGSRPTTTGSVREEVTVELTTRTV